MKRDWRAAARANRVVEVEQCEGAGWAALAMKANARLAKIHVGCRDRRRQRGLCGERSRCLGGQRSRLGLDGFR